MINLGTYPRDRLIARTHNHLYLRPHPALSQAIAHYTITFPAQQWPGESVLVEDKTGQSIILLPDVSGCFVFNVKDLQGRFWGATTKAVAMTRDFETAPMRFFVEFLPGGAHQLLGLSMAQVTDQYHAMDDIFPALNSQIQQILFDHEDDIAAIVREIEKIFLEALKEKEELSAGHLLGAIAWDGVVTVKSAAEAIGYSERHLNRLFNQRLGVSVKTCARVFRINHLLSDLTPGVTLAHLAQSAGYYDQSHLNHDFKAVCGVAPTKYLASMSDFYKEDFKF